MKPGDEVTLKRTGERYVVTRSAREGGSFAFDYSLAPGAPGPPEHSHDHDDEFFEMVSGTLRLRVDGQERTVHAGERFSVPAGVRHGLANDGSVPVQIRIEYSGAGIEEVLAGLRTVLARGPRLTDAFHMAVITQDHLASSRPASPLLRGAIHVMGTLGRRLGFGPPLDLTGPRLCESRSTSKSRS